MKASFGRNIVGSVAIALMFLAATLVAPPMYLSQAELYCQRGVILGQFEDMKACGKDPRFREGCSCAPLDNPWSRIFWYILLPIAVALCGYKMLRGSVAVRLSLLNGAVAVALAALFIRAVLKDYNAMIALLDLPLILGAFCVSATVAFLVITYVHRTIMRKDT